MQLQDFSTFPHSDRKVLQQLKQMLDADVPKMLQKIAGVSKNSYDADESEDGGGADGEEKTEEGSKESPEAEVGTGASKKTKKKALAAAAGSGITLKEANAVDAAVKFLKENDDYVNITVVILVVALAIAILYFKDDGETVMAYVHRAKASLGGGSK